MTNEFADITCPNTPDTFFAADLAAAGKQFPPQQQLLLYSPADWEEFVQEWVYFGLKTEYKRIARFSGAGDKGIDIAGFTDTEELQGLWDNYQCKHYKRALRPSDALPEIGKCLYHSFKDAYRPPRAFYFIAPHGTTTDLTSLLANAQALRERVLSKWDDSIRDKITDTLPVELEGDFRAYVEAFDFSIFSAKASIELVDSHRKNCPHHAQRFGGGLPARPHPGQPPIEIQQGESRYIAQLFAAYSDHKKQAFASPSDLAAVKALHSHFVRQREAFYHAEQLRVFARDTVPPGTFEALQDDIFTGVIDTHDADHPDGYQRVCKVTEAARQTAITANALIPRTNPKDRDGICHQLANDDRLQWVKS